MGIFKTYSNALRSASSLENKAARAAIMTIYNDCKERVREYNQSVLDEYPYLAEYSDYVSFCEEIGDELAKIYSISTFDVISTEDLDNARILRGTIENKVKKNSENLETTAKEAKKCIDEMDDFLGKNKMFFTATLRCSNNRKLCFFSYEKRRIVKPNGAIYLSVLTPITYDVSEKRKFRRFTTVELSPFEYKFEVMTRDEFENGLLMARLTTFEFSDERDLIEYDNFLRNLFSMEEE